MSYNLRKYPYKGVIPRPPRIRPTGFGRRPAAPTVFIQPPGDPAIPLMVKPTVHELPPVPISPLNARLITGRKF